MEKVLFEYDSYKKFVADWLGNMPKKGHGQLSRMARRLGVSSVSVSHVFNGPRDLSEEQAVELSEFLGLTELESDYFLLLVRQERAGTHKLKDRIRAKMTKLRDEAQDLKTRLTQDLELDDDAKAQFYSNWFYSGARLACAIDGLHRVESLAEYLDMPRAKLREVLDFLLKYGLVIQKDGLYYSGPKRTHLSAGSLLVSRHHSNWRLKGIESMGEISPDDLFYSGPMTMSFETAKEIRRDLVDLIDRTVKKIEPSPPEKLACLNIDWFGIKRGD